MMGKIATQCLSVVDHLLGFLQKNLKFLVFLLQELLGSIGLPAPLLQSELQGGFLLLLPGDLQLLLPDLELKRLQLKKTRGIAG